MRKNTDQIVIYRGDENSWGDILPRSKLYNLQPLNIRDHRRESLVSYINGLARAHSVNPRHLFRHVFASADSDFSKLKYNSFYVTYLGTANGLGPYARKLSRVTNFLTGRTDLERLTMLNWSDVIPEKSEGFLAKHPRWCPRCFEEQLATTSEVFTPLVWSLQLYKTCTKHFLPLQEQCPYCAKKQAFLPNFPDVSRCQYCGGLLSHVGSATPISNEPLATELIIESMIDLQDNEGVCLKLESFRQSVELLLNETCAGNRAHFCRMMGWNIWALNGWLNKGEKVTFPKLIELSLQFATNPVDICSGHSNFKSVALDSSNRTRYKLTNRGTRPQLSEIQRQRIVKVLCEELSSTAMPMPLNEIALRCGLTRGGLKYWFGDICGRICSRRKAIREERASEARSRRSKIVREAMDALVEMGTFPSRRKVDDYLRKHGLALARPELFDIYQHNLQSEKKYG